MILKKTAIVVLYTIASHTALAQQFCDRTFSGRVKAESGEYLVGATLQLLPIKRGAATDENGYFYLKDVCAGNYQVVVQYLGYKTIQFDLDLTKSEERIISLEPDVTNLREVVVKDQLLTLDHAKNYAVLTERQLDETAGKSLGESLKEITGVSTIQAGPGIFKPVIHGVHSQRVLILNHGIRQEGQQWGAEHAPEIDPFIASNIVVIKDASSIKYGTDALGGVVVVNPPPLPEHAGINGSINTVVQSNGRSGAVSGTLAGGIKNHDGWGWRVQGTIKRSGDFHTPDYSLTNTGIKELDFSAATGYHRDKAGFEIFFSQFQTELGILKGTSISSLRLLDSAMTSEPPQYTRSFGYQIEEPRQEVRHQLLKLNGHINTPHGQLRVQYGFQQNNRKEFDIRKGSLKSIPSIDLLLFTHTVETEWETAVPDKSFCIGLTGMYQDNSNIFGTQRIPFIPNFVSATAGAYAVSKITLKNWVVDVGVRYDYRNYQVSGFDYKNSLYRSKLQFNNASATIGATGHLNHNQTVNLSLSNAWRPPHVAELYSLGTHQSAAANEYGLLLNDSSEVININDASFNNEQALKFVCGYRYTRKSISADVTIYGNYIFNYIFLQPTGITTTARGVYPYFRYRQTDALFLGTDVSASWKMSDHFTSSSKISLLRASDVSNDDYLVFIPANRYEFSLRYQPPRLEKSDFYVEIKFKYTVRQNRAPRVVTPGEIIEASEQGNDPFQGNKAFDFMSAPSGYILFNAASGYSLKRDRVSYDFRISAENILNTSYREYSNRFRYYADDMGRNISLSIKCIF